MGNGNSFYSLASFEEFASAAGASDEQDAEFVHFALCAATAQSERYCMRHLLAKRVVQYVDWTYDDKVQLAEYPVRAVLSARAANFYPLAESERLASDDYFVFPTGSMNEVCSTLYIQERCPLYGRRKLLRIKYIAGYRMREDRTLGGYAEYVEVKEKGYAAGVFAVVLSIVVQTCG